MGMTMTQKILAAHAGLDSVTAGQLIECSLDVVMANDITGPMALPIFRQMAAASRRVRGAARSASPTICCSMSRGSRRRVA